MSRSTVIDQMSNNVTGTFLLHDLLSISTLSGSIDITIVPQPASASNHPAELRLNTASGSIRVKMAPFVHNPSTVMPERIFNSSLESMSGSISAALVHNYKTSLSTMSGNIAASVYPLGQPSSMSLVDIQCTSGSASMTLHPIVNDPQASLRNLSTNFRGSSGGLSIRFPSTWEGEVISHLSNGSVRHAWEDLRVVNDGLRFRATKGNGSGQLNIWGNSVNVELVGERVPDSPREREVKEGERVPDLPREVEPKEGEHNPVTPGMPGLPRGREAQGEGDGTSNLPKEEEQREEDDDEWTVVEDEEGAPTYEDSTRT